MELHKICRICLKSDLLVSIFSPTFLLRPIEMIEKLNICKVDDKLPKFLCQSCLYRLLDAYNLQELANASERQLRQYFGHDEFSTLYNNHGLMSSETFSVRKNGNEAASFTGLFTGDIFQEDIQNQHIEENDILNDNIEIDVSSLTRSEAGDTLSEVFVDAQINCHYETESHRFGDSIVGNDSVEFQNVIKSASPHENEINKIASSRFGKGKNVKVAEKCQECNKSFSTSGYLALHKQYVHTGERPFKCKLCPRRFVQNSNLRLHERVHSGERRFQCEICSSFFTTSSNLKAHSLTHRETRDYKCEQCDKCFKSIRELRRHEPIHSSVKEICNLCEKAFSKRSYLNAHILSVHRNIKKHKCKDCFKVFASKSNLQCHMRIHSGEKPFQCKHCDWKFNQSSALLRHVLKKHPESKVTEKMSNTTQENVYGNEKCMNSSGTENLGFQMPYVANPSLSVDNDSMILPGSMYHSSVTLSNYDYNKLGQTLYTTAG